MNTPNPSPAASGTPRPVGAVDATLISSSPAEMIGRPRPPPAELERTLTSTRLRSEPGAPGPESGPRDDVDANALGLDRTRLSHPSAQVASLEQAPAKIGRFTVLRTLGEGGMGVVYAAYDEELDRKIAIKVLRDTSQGSDARARMVREAQAMARLSHPNVVQVHDVGDHLGQIYVAMEFVKGVTLRGWLQEQRRGWQEIRDMFLQAGRGLAAAHAEGIVHRDFKPDNVLVDADGRARVLDFGLVHREGGPSDDDLVTAQMPAPTLPNVESVERTDLHWSVRLTRMGNVLGTPAYMSPEQHFGRQAGAASDQFSFCITLYEALYGSRPFGGDTWAAIRTQVQEGTVPPPPLESRVPRRLFKVLARGLAKGPEERWPSMDALLEALERDPWRTRTRVAAMIGLIGAASAASYAVAISQVGGKSCVAASELLAGAWDPGREAAVSRAFTATHAPFAADTWNRVKPRIDGYAQAWLGEWHAACEAQASGAPMRRLVELKVACLGRRKAHLAALVDVLAAADQAVVENAIQAVAALPSIAACDDEEALLTASAPPEDAAMAEKVDELRSRLAQGAALETTGQYEQGLKVVSEIRGAADGLGFMPLIAETNLHEGRLLMQLGRAQLADAALVRAIQTGIAHDLHALAAEAATIRIYVIGETLGLRAEALSSAPFAEALVDRARGDTRLFALLLNNLGLVHNQDDKDRANAYFERAVEVLRQRPGPVDPLIGATYHNLGNLLLEQGQLEAALGRYQQSVEQFTALLGDSHPLVAHPLAGIADVHLRKGQAEAAIPIYFRALALMEGSHGLDHPYLLVVLPGLGRAQKMIGNVDEARRTLARVVSIADSHAIRSPEVAAALEGLADLAAVDGANEQARDLYARAATLFDEAHGADGATGARAALRAGELDAELGDVAGATAWFERVLAKKTGSKGQDEARGGAALRLAAIVAERDGARACTLATEARARLPEGDPRRAEAEALSLRTCPKG